MTKRIGAFSFKSSLDRLSIKSKVQELGSFDWMGGDSDNYGLYLKGDPIPDDWPVTLRVYGEGPPEYLIEFGYHYSKLAKGQTADAVIAFVKDQFLPAIGATNVTETESIR